MKNKYLKYKTKYLKLKEQIGGNAKLDLIDAIRTSEEHFNKQIYLENIKNFYQYRSLDSGKNHIITLIGENHYNYGIKIDSLKNHSVINIVDYLYELGMNTNANIYIENHEDKSLNLCNKNDHMKYMWDNHKYLFDQNSIIDSISLVNSDVNNIRIIKTMKYFSSRPFCGLVTFTNTIYKKPEWSTERKRNDYNFTFGGGSAALTELVKLSKVNTEFRPINANFRYDIYNDYVASQTTHEFSINDYNDFIYKDSKCKGKKCFVPNRTEKKWVNIEKLLDDLFIMINNYLDNTPHHPNLSELNHIIKDVVSMMTKWKNEIITFTQDVENRLKKEYKTNIDYRISNPHNIEDIYTDYLLQPFDFNNYNYDDLLNNNHVKNLLKLDNIQYITLRDMIKALFALINDLMILENILVTEPNKFDCVYYGYKHIDNLNYILTTFFINEYELVSNNRALVKSNGHMAWLEDDISHNIMNDIYEKDVRTAYYNLYNTLLPKKESVKRKLGTSINNRPTKRQRTE